MRDFGNALVVSLISVGLMLGALSISLVEFVPEATPTCDQYFIRITCAPYFHIYIAANCYSYAWS